MYPSGPQMLVQREPAEVVTMKIQIQLTPNGTTHNCMDYFVKCLTDAATETMRGLSKQHVSNVFYPNLEFYRRCQTDPISAIAKAR